MRTIPSRNLPKQMGRIVRALTMRSPTPVSLFVKWPRAKLGSFARVLWDPYSPRKTKPVEGGPTIRNALLATFWPPQVGTSRLNAAQRL
jgi:hypothetical protein